ncbi:Site-specific recombinase XerD [Modestobacter sp. DSM 44400]|uniref:tyrosine-type recombinase/integrase n=1 Tax=Modestobacter sp. DSM 44400 TaxID=1550230 RepID=UPI000896243C|nr:site-specific integrase [Modestobacter sp. DSM 44400]SDY84756.1 Site-specific recombinase XerD [Modestobacter sp. DSM 44400]
MASVEARQTRRSGRDAKVYDVRFRDPDGRQRKRTFGKKGDADRFAATVEADKLRGQYIDHSDRTTVAEYARAWAAARPHRPTTARRVSGLIEVHIAGTRLGSRRVAAVRPSEIQAWASDRAQVLAPSTLRSLVSLLRSIYASAVLDRLAPSSPVVRIAFPRYERPRVVPLSVEQVRDLADAMSERHRALVITQAGLGLRIGELLALRVEDVDFLRRAVRIEWQFAPKARVRSEPKTPRSRRVIPLPQTVADALAGHIATHPPGSDGSIFSTQAGTRLTHHRYGSELFGAAVKKAGLPVGTTSHDLRHHYASVLLAAGESVVAIAERLGHENASLVLSTYGHLMPDSEERTRRAIDDAWCAIPAPLTAVTSR